MMKDLNIEQWESTFITAGEIGVERDVWGYLKALEQGKEPPVWPDKSMIEAARRGLVVIDEHAATGSLVALTNAIWDRLPHPIELEAQRRQFLKRGPIYTRWLNLIALLNGPNSVDKFNAEAAARDHLGFSRNPDGRKVTMCDFVVHPAHEKSLMALMPKFAHPKKAGPTGGVPWAKNADAMDALRRAESQDVAVAEASRSYASAEGKQDNVDRRGEYLAELYRKKMSIRAHQ
jgi:hypothetical protein